jgi:ribose/xylose/arabinose/galactoside ABC-type transport system permease subunit
MTSNIVSEKKPAPLRPPEEAGRSRRQTLDFVRELWAWIFLVILVAAFTVAARSLNNTNFLSVRGVQAILLSATQVLFVGLGETLVIISGGIDLSVGWILGLSAVMAATVMQIMFAANADPTLTIIAGALAGMAVSLIPGFLNGWLVAKIKVPPFISTLGMGGVIQGAAFLRSGGYPVASQPPYSGQLGNGYLMYYWPGHTVSFFNMPEGVQSVRDVVPLVPVPVLVATLVTLVIWFVMAKTQFGQHIYAVGGNFQAAMRAGIPVDWTLIRIYVLSALMCGIAGVVWAWRFTSGAADAGQATTLTAVAAVVIGGASLFGGEGKIAGTVVGSLIIATIDFGLVVLGVVPFWQFVAVGTVVILAVIVDQLGRSLGN